MCLHDAWGLEFAGKMLFAVEVAMSFYSGTPEKPAESEYLELHIFPAH